MNFQTSVQMRFSMVVNDEVLKDLCKNKSRLAYKKEKDGVKPHTADLFEFLG